ncbi:MAG: YcxB family protein [Salaquimonas sp.]
MKVQYTYTFEDYEAIDTARKQNRHFAKIRDLVIWLLIGLNFAIGLVFLWWMVTGHLGFNWWNFGNLLIGILILVAIYVVGPWYRHWYLRQQMIEGKTVQLDFDDDGIFADLENNTVKTQWAGVYRADELATHFVIWINKLQAYSVPKRAIGSDENYNKLKALLTAKVENRTFDK